MSGKPALPSVFEPILNTVIDAVIVLAQDGTVLGWNPMSEVTFGWSAEEACGRALSDIIIPESHRDAHRDGMKRLEAGEQPRVLNRRLELPAVRKDGRQITVELSITSTATAGEEYFIGFLRDISDRRNAEDLLRQKLAETELLFDVTRMTGEANSFEEALRKVLQAVCSLNDWQAGHAFLVDKGNPDLLRSSDIWHEQVPGCASAMREASEGLTFARGDGLPGTVLRQGGPVWLSDINVEGNFFRQGYEFRGAFGFPLMHQGAVIAVLEFFSPSPSAPEKSQLLLAQALGEQLGRVVERVETNERREILLNELNHRNKNLLTVVQSMIRLSFAGVEGVEGPVQKLNERLSAMARAQDLLVSQQWTESTLSAVVKAGITGYENFAGRLHRHGPEIPVHPNDVQAAVLVLHELCTNALKYGAFSCEEGRIDIEWGYCGAGEERSLFFQWIESGCGKVATPSRQGLGTGLLRRGLFASGGNRVEIDFGEDGLVYRCEAAAPAVTAALA